MQKEQTRIGLEQEQQETRRAQEIVAKSSTKHKEPIVKALLASMKNGSHGSKNFDVFLKKASTADLRETLARSNTPEFSESVTDETAYAQYNKALQSCLSVLSAATMGIFSVPTEKAAIVTEKEQRHQNVSNLESSSDLESSSENSFHAGGIR